MTMQPQANNAGGLHITGSRPATAEERRRFAQAAQDEAQKLAQQAQEDLDLLDREEQEEQYAKIQQIRAEREGRLADAAGFREMARNEPDPEEQKNLLKLALNEQRVADELGRQLGIEPEGEAKPFVPFLKRPIASFIQVAGVMLLIGLMYRWFNSLHDDIKRMAEGSPGSVSAPYDAVSIQKFAYEKLVVFTDLPLALGIVLLILPVVGFYVLPIVRGKRDFYTEFTNDLTPWQRSLLSVILCLGVLFYLALSHSVKP